MYLNYNLLLDYMKAVTSAFLLGRREMKRASEMGRGVVELMRQNTHGQILDTEFVSLTDVLLAEKPSGLRAQSIGENGTRVDKIALALGYYSRPIRFATALYDLYRMLEGPKMGDFSYSKI